jgi:hypothetical protein
MSVLLGHISDLSGKNSMLYIEHFRMRSCVQISLSLMLASTILMFCTPCVFCSAEKYYYYLHVSSFRLKERAVKDVERIRNQGYNAVARRERVSDKGYWYRIYIGPFSSLQEAKLKAEELRRHKIAEYIAIHKKESLISAELEEKKVPVEVEKPAPEVSPAREVTPAVPERPVTVSPPPEKPPEIKEVPAPPIEKREEVKRPLPPPPPRKIKAKPPREALEFAPKGIGRNMRRGDFSLGLRHTYREVDPELTERKRITSDGTTTTIEDVSIAGVQNDDFPTRVHMDSLRIRFGVTDYVEGFAEIGGAYREFSGLGFIYGGGLRLNLFEVKKDWFRGLYGALQGEYSSGTVGYEYNSSSGNKWKKETEWREFVAKGELGVTRSQVSTYIGGVYFHYDEDTERHLLENFPSPLTSYVLQDELEEDSFGAFGGIDINLTPSLLLNVEGQVAGGKGIFGTLEYHF